MTAKNLLPLALALALLDSCSDQLHGLRDPSSQRATQGNSGMRAGKMGMSVARGTTLSLLRQPIATARVGAVVLWERPRALIAGNLPHPGRYLPSPAEAPGSEAFERLLDQKRISSPAMAKLTWLVDGKKFFPEFGRQIAAAKQSVDVQVYIFDTDEIAVRYADLLKKRANDVPVRVLFDDMGSSVAGSSAPKTPPSPGFRYPSSMSKYLREGNVHVRSMLNPFLVCDHTKLHVFDQHVALMGCTNIGREYYSEWHDLMFRVEGPAVAKLQEDYNNTWNRADPKGLFGLFRKKSVVTPPPAVSGMIPIRIIRTDPAKGRYEIRKSMLLGIRAARKRIWIEDPYVSNDDITGALEDAAKRGVDVRLIYPGQNDSKLMDVGNHAFADKLQKAGGKAYRYPRMSHMKVMICDDWACVGSANLDTLSMRINRELNITFNDRGEINRLIQQVFVPDFAKSTRHKYSSSPASPLAEAVADQL